MRRKNFFIVCEYFKEDNVTLVGGEKSSGSSVASESSVPSEISESSVPPESSVPSEASGHSSDLRDDGDRQ